MKIIDIIPLFFLTSCSLSIGQQSDEELKKEKEYREVIQKAKETSEENKVVIMAADEKTTKIIDKTTSTIVSLKEEVKQLKQELNEKNNYYDDIDDGFKFSLRPISDGKENR